MAENHSITVEPGSATPQPEQPQPTLPEVAGAENLRNKFKGPNAVQDLMNSYQELEQRLSQGPQTPPPAPTPKPTAAQVDKQTENLLGLDALQPLMDEFGEKGTISDESYQALQKRGVSREVVDMVVQGQVAAAERLAESCFAAAGGKESYEQMQQWLGENGTQQDIDAYNRAINSGDMALARMAVEAMAARFQGAGAPQAQAQPARIEGMPAGGQTVTGFRTNHEWRTEIRKAQDDGRYSDQNYQKWLQARVAASDPSIFG